MLPSSERGRWTLAVAAGCLVLAAINIWWVLKFRDGYPLDVDEAGYTGIGLNNYFGLQNGGLHGWWEAVQTQTPNAPLLPAITSLVLVAKQGIVEGFVVLIGFAALLTFAAYGLGERLAGPRLGALAALAVATSQGAFIYTREYVFALPTAAWLSCAAFALVRSDGMRSRLWSILCGVAVGLMLLSRTMAVAFVPGVVVAAVVLILFRGQGDYPRRALNLGLAVLAAFLVAITWYWRNLQPVLDYLTDFGYGSQSQYYGAEHSLFSWARIETVAERILVDDLLAPLAILVFAGLLAGGYLLVQRLRAAEDRRAELVRLAGTDAIAVLLIFLAGFAALMSSRNGGNGFTFPIAMLLPPLAVIALRRFQRAVIPVVAVVAAIAAVNLVAHLDLWDSASDRQLVYVPPFGEVPWVNGSPHAVDAIRVQVPGSANHFEESEKGWAEVDEALADLSQEPIGPEGAPPFIAFASRHRVISTNSVGLSALMKYRVGVPMTQIEAEPDTVAHYEQLLTDPAAGLPSGLVTMSSEAGDFEPVVTQAYVETAARNAGFRIYREYPLPDGRDLRFWLRDESPGA